MRLGKRGIICRQRSACSSKNITSRIADALGVSKALRRAVSEYLTEIQHTEESEKLGKGDSQKHSFLERRKVKKVIIFVIQKFI